MLSVVAAVVVKVALCCVMLVDGDVLSVKFVTVSCTVESVGVTSAVVCVRFKSDVVIVVVVVNFPFSVCATAEEMARR